MNSIRLFSFFAVLLGPGCDSESSKPDHPGSSTNTETENEGVPVPVDSGEPDDESGVDDTGEGESDAPDATDPPQDSDTAAEDSGTVGIDTGEPDTVVLDTGETDTGETEAVTEDDGVFRPDWPEGTDPFGDEVVSFEPGPDAGFGSDDFPEIVLGSPHGSRGGGGSLHVLSLGELGSIVIEFTDLGIIDGPGADLLVFENPFPGWSETAIVEVSNDGETWTGWFCDAENAEEGFPGCAGIASVYATPELLIDPTDPEVAGGDAFDLADIGVESARFVRITDSGFNALGYGGTTGGFDLDAVGIANWTPLSAE